MSRAARAVTALVAPTLVVVACAAAALAATGDARRALDEGGALFSAGRFEEAAARFEEAAALAAGEALDPAVARYDQATALLSAGKPGESAAAFAVALGSPDPALRAMAFYNRGNALAAAAESAEQSDDLKAALGLLDQALAAYEGAMRIDPRDEDAKVNHGLVSRRKARLQERMNQPERQQDRPSGAPPPPPADARGAAAPPRDREKTERDMTPDEARALLDAMRQQEISQRDRIRPAGERPYSVGNDW